MTDADLLREMQRIRQRHPDTADTMNLLIDLMCCGGIVLPPLSAPVTAESVYHAIRALQGVA